MQRIYIAGKYNGPDVISVLANMRRGIAFSCQIMKAGFAPFVPWLDFQLGLCEDFPLKTYKECSLEWVKVCDALILVPDSEISAGVQAEIDLAIKMGIPVFDTLRSLVLWDLELIKNHKGNVT